ncbi:DUF1799 domain-containing protein [Pseudomonas syringae]|uniref:Phage protein n=1 Tax=Pseudomonas syringae TaxID=317 RepID=A0A085V3Y5_PSESX|nr:DUF1799 domain-containing protein [Pseudomonas syringae]KFE50148.1 hypothetical protein IV01_26110 [Pseudomonas syringae]
MSMEDMQEEIELWEINTQSFTVFNSMSTQWRTGMGGATGLDYAVLPVVMELLDVEQDDRKRVFGDVRLMEQEALDTMADARD